MRLKVRVYVAPPWGGNVQCMQRSWTDENRRNKSVVFCSSLCVRSTFKKFFLKVAPEVNLMLSLMLFKFCMVACAGHLRQKPGVNVSPDVCVLQSDVLTYLLPQTLTKAPHVDQSTTKNSPNKCTISFSLLDRSYSEWLFYMPGTWSDYFTFNVATLVK